MAEPEHHRRASHSQLIDAVKDSFHTYLGPGSKVKLPGIRDEPGTVSPELDIENLSEVLRVHFILTGDAQMPEREQVRNPDVAPFVFALPDRLRRLKSETTLQRNVVKGGIKGQVDWSATIERYSKRGLIDPTEYVCIEQQAEYETVQNIVLKTLLELIYSIFENELQEAVENPEQFEWLDEWLRSGGLKSHLDQALQQNPYLEQVDTDQSVSRREIEIVKQARSSLYREAARLLERYRSLLNQSLENEDIDEVLTHAYIYPDRHNGAALFELHWLFRLLDLFENPQYRIISQGVDCIADWTAHRSDFGPFPERESIDPDTQRLSRYRAFHHTTGPDQLEFGIAAEDLDAEINALRASAIEHPFTERLQAVEQHHRFHAKQAFGKSPHETIWRGIPDMLLLETDVTGEELRHLFIGEVKYSRNVGYIVDGIEQLLEYLYYAKWDNKYVIDQPESSHLPSTISGAVFCDQLTEPPEDIGIPISIVEFGDESMSRILW